MAPPPGMKIDERSEPVRDRRRVTDPMALTFGSKLVHDQRLSPNIAGSRTRLEQNLVALGHGPRREQSYKVIF